MKTVLEVVPMACMTNVAWALKLECGHTRIEYYRFLPEFVTRFWPKRARCYTCEGPPHTSFYHGSL